MTKPPPTFLPYEIQYRLLMTRLHPEPPSPLKTRTTSLLDVSIYHQLSPPLLHPLSVTPDEFRQLQESCPSLKCLRTKATTREVKKVRDGATYQFIHEDSLLYRKCLSSDRPRKVNGLSLVVPSDYRPVILRVVHEGPLAGHFSHRKTQMKVSQYLLVRYVRKHPGLLPFLR